MLKGQQQKNQAIMSQTYQVECNKDKIEIENQFSF